jgi:hypothetical protein
MPVALKTAHCVATAKRHAKLDSQLRFIGQSYFYFASRDRNRQFRSIDNPGKARRARQVRLSLILHCGDRCAYPEARAHHFRKAKRPFDVASTSGGDQSKLKQVIHEMASLASPKVVVALDTKSRANAGADLLKWGASEIQDCGRRAKECLARLRAILRRRGWARMDDETLCVRKF